MGKGTNTTAFLSSFAFSMLLFLLLNYCILARTGSVASTAQADRPKKRRTETALWTGWDTT